MIPTTASFVDWWFAKSETFTKLCATEEKESFTHGDVVMTHVLLVLFFVLLFITDWLGGLLL